MDASLDEKKVSESLLPRPFVFLHTRSMAKGAQKRIASGNASAVNTLAYGFVISNTVHLLFNFWLWRSPATMHWRPIALYVVTEVIAAALGLQLTSMARAGDDLSQSGLTAYMFDIVYITWFVHVTTALFSRYFWWTYAVVREALTQIPAYATYLLYTHVLVPYVLGGQSPLRRARTPSAAPAQEEAPVSKRQAKQQARASRGTRRQTVRG